MEIIKQIDESCVHHRHEHSEKDTYPSEGITSRIHDGALVCSVSRHIKGDLEKIRENLENELGLLDTWVEELEGVTGHIKAIISVNGPAYRISATAGEVETKNLSIKNIHVSIVAIVFQIDQEVMEKRIEYLLERLSPQIAGMELPE